MTEIQNKLLCAIVEKVFGNVSECIVNILSKRDNLPLIEIIKPCRANEPRLKLDLIKKSLAVLLYHNLVRAQRLEKKTIVYSLQLKACYSLIRWSRYTYVVNHAFGEIAEFVVEELLLAGRATTSQIILNTAERFQQQQSQDNKSDNAADISKIGQTMARLLTVHHVLERAPTALVEPEEDTEETKNAAKLRFVLPSNHDSKLTELRRSWANSMEQDDDEEPPSKRVRVDEEAEKEEPQFRVNIDRVEALWRDEILVKRAEERTERVCADFLRHFLTHCRIGKPEHVVEWGLVSPAVAEVEIRRSLPADLAALPVTHLDQCVRLLNEDVGAFLFKTEQTASGCLLMCPFQRAWGQLVLEMVESTVQEQLGAQAKRAFRLIWDERYVGLEHIYGRVMLNQSLCRQLVFQLENFNFIKKQELSKSNDFSTTSASYLYHVDLPAVVRMLLQWAYHAMLRLMRCREHRIVSHQRLLDKQMAVEGVLLEIEEQINALEASADSDETEAQKEVEALQQQREEALKNITSVERQQLQDVERGAQKLSQAEVELDEQIFIMERYLRLAQLGEGGT